MSLMKKLLPLIAIIAAVSFSVPVIAGEGKGGAHHEKSMHHGKKHAKGHKGKHHGQQHGKMQKAAPQQQGNMRPANMMMQRKPAAPAKVWMPSMTRGFHK